jgi:hypothetical protein
MQFPFGHNRGRDRSRGHGGLAGYPQPFAGAFAIYDPTAQRVAPLNGSTVQSFASFDGLHPLAQATGAKQPTWSASSANFNGQSVITDTGGSTNTVLLASTAADWTFLHNGTGMTIMAVALATNTTNHWLLDTNGGGSTSRGIGMFNIPGNLLRFVMGTGAAAVLDVSTGNAFSLNAGHVVIATHLTGDVGNDFHLRIDRSQKTGQNNANTPSALAPVGPLAIGNYSNAAPVNSWIGSYAFVAFWNRVLTASEQSTAESYSLSRFAV